VAYATVADGTVDGFGPIDSLVIEFPNGAIGADGFNQLLDLVNNKRIRILDLEFVKKQSADTSAILPAHDLGSVDGLDLAIFDGASAGLYGAEDLAELNPLIAVGSVAAVIIYEELSLLPVIASWERIGAKVVGDGSLTIDDLVIALDAVGA